MMTHLGNEAPGADTPVVSALDPIIETDRLVLRPFRMEDTDALWPLVSDPELPRLMSWSAHTDPEQTRQWIASTLVDGWAKGTGACWTITIDGAVSGSIGLHGIRYQAGGWRVDSAELGYWLAQPHRRRGLMTEAAAAVMRFGWEQLKLHKITVSCLAENSGSRRVIEKLAFRLIGNSRDDVYRDGRWHDHLRYELTRVERSRRQIEDGGAEHQTQR